MEGHTESRSEQAVDRRLEQSIDRSAWSVYQLYLSLLDRGISAESYGGFFHGSTCGNAEGDTRCGGCRFLSLDGARVGGFVESSLGHIRLDTGVACSCGGRVADGTTGEGDGDSSGVSEDVRVDVAVRSSSDAGVGCGGLADDGQPVRSEKTEANRKRREQRKARKLRKQEAAAAVNVVPEWRRKGPGVSREQALTSRGGFWNSCSPETRKNLIESKAKMHIAENERKMREAENRSNYLVSPQAAVERAVRLTDYAKDLEHKKGSVYGYAKTVSTATAEGMVKALPDSVTSYEDYEKRKIASETSTLVESLNGEISDLKVKLAEFEGRSKESAEEERQVRSDAMRAAEMVVELRKEVASLKKFIASGPKAITVVEKKPTGIKPTFVRERSYGANNGYSNWYVPHDAESFSDLEDQC